MANRHGQEGGFIGSENVLVPMTIALFAIGLILGGGATSSYLSMFVELPACVLATMALAGLFSGRCPRQAYAGIVLLALTCAVPVLQLVPLSAHVWSALPGREIPSAISRMAGLGELGRPLSLNPEQTRLAALCMIVPAATFLATLQCGLRGRDQFIMAVVGFAALSAVIGVFQVASGGEPSLGIYRQSHVGSPVGFFANRNHEADLLLIAIPFSARLASIRAGPPGTNLAILSIAVVFFSLSVVATMSRAGLALLPVALAGAMLVWIGDLRDRRIWLGAGALFVAAIAAFLLIRVTPVGHRVLARFNDVGEDLRPAIWQGTWSAIKTFWPAGSGIGCFVPVYKMVEDLNTVSVEYVNHAHDDYLELLLETGAAGAALMAVYGVLLLWALWRSVPSILRGQRYATASALAILLGHALTDYSLRTFGLLTIFAFCNAAVFVPDQAYRVRRSGIHPASPQPDFALDQRQG